MRVITWDTGVSKPKICVYLFLYDISGRLVETLLEGLIQPGIHTVKWDAGDFPSGVYFVKLETGNHFKTNKVLLIK